MAKKPGKEARRLLLEAAGKLGSMAGFSEGDIAAMLRAMADGEKFWKDGDGTIHEIT